MRIRSIKPEFFTDEDIALLPALCRIAFQGLWCHADKAGRLEDRPHRLKVLVLPYDDVDFVEVLNALVAARFVQRYSGPDGRAYLQIRSFLKHQRPRPDEPESQLPIPESFTDPDEYSLLGSDEPDTAERIGKEGKGKELRKEGSTRPSGARPPVQAQDIVDLWNQSVTSPIPQVTKLTTDRKAKIDARLKAYPDLDTWQTAIDWVNTQAWCRAPGIGEHGSWVATLDWLTKNDSKLQRCIEQASTAKPVRTRSNYQPIEAVFDWNDECRELHGGECGSPWRHEQTKVLAAAKAEREAKAS